MESADPQSSEAGLGAAVRNLSLSGKDALANLPAASRGAHTLALSFDHEYTIFMEHMTSLPEASQLLSLQELDSALNAISGPENVALWSDASFVNDSRWNTIRSLAEAVLDEFGW